MNAYHPLFSYLAAVGLTLLVYALCDWLYSKLGKPAILHPLFISAAGLIVSTKLGWIELSWFLQHTTPLTALVVPATMMLSVPLYNQMVVIKAHGIRLIIPIAIGGLCASILGWLSIYLFSTNLALQLTMATKSITTPFAMITAEAIGGIPALAACFVIITGIIVAILSPLVFYLMRETNELNQGIVLGVTGHAVGTTKALSISELAGAMATVGVCVNGVVTALVIPLIF